MKPSSVLVMVAVLIAASLPGGSASAAQPTASHSVVMLHAVPVGVTPTVDMATKTAATIDAVQAFLIQDVGRTLRVQSGLTVVSVQAGQSAGQMGAALGAAGYDDPNKIYLVFADAPGVNDGCGITLGGEPAFSFVLMPACNIFPGEPPQTFPFDATYLVLHEVLHALGAVPSCAPNEGNGSHSTDSNRDILYSGLEARDWSNLTIDPGNDDYYGHANAGCADIEDSPYWATAAAPRCAGMLVTIDMNTNGGNGSGTAAADVILGTPGGDTINGLGGGDTICGGDGDDTIFGGDGPDQVFGDLGDDTIHGDLGWDTLDGSRGNDVVYGGPGSDVMFGGWGDDQVYGEDGDDLILGFGGVDVLQGGPGKDRINGQNGDDTIDGGAQADQLWGAFGDDSMAGGDGWDLLFGGWGADVMDGGPGGDTLYGEANDDTLRGGPGNDNLQGGWSNDRLDGGVGFDTCNGDIGIDTAVGCENISGVS